MSELSNCPFCDCPHPRLFVTPDEHGRPSHGVQCGGTDCCIAGPERGSQEEAITAWNRRADTGKSAEAWSSVSDGLPETFVTDDSECWLEGKRVKAAINSERVLVALAGGGVRVDRLTGLEGRAPWWETFKDRVTHWKLPPQHPENKQ